MRVKAPLLQHMRQIKCLPERLCVIFVRISKGYQKLYGVQEANDI